MVSTWISIYSISYFKILIIVPITKPMLPLCHTGKFDDQYI